jgi:hypothetical protein
MPDQGLNFDVILEKREFEKLLKNDDTSFNYR